MAMTDQILGLRLQRTSPAQITVTPGWARSEDDTVDIVSSSALTVATGTSGLGGLDTGSVAQEERYAVWLLRNPSGAVGAVFSLSFEAAEVTLPAGWSSAALRRIGSASTNSNGNFVSFRQLGMHNERRYLFDSNVDGRQILTGGTASTWTPVARTSRVPPTAEQTLVYLVPSSAEVEARSIGAQKQLFATTAVTFGFTTEHDDDLLEYRKVGAGGSVDAYLLGYMESL